MSADTKSVLREFITRELAPGLVLSDDHPLLETGVLDSIAVIKLITYIEQTFATELPADDRDDPDNFETLAAIAAMVDRNAGG